MQLAVDQFTCRIKVTGVGGGLRHDVEQDLAEAVKHFLDGLTVAHLPGVVRRGENILDCDLAPGYDRLEPEAFNIEPEVVHQADAGPARRRNVPRWHSIATVSSVQLGYGTAESEKPGRRTAWYMFRHCPGNRRPCGPSPA